MWSNHSLAARRWASDNASSGFNGSSMTIRSAPRPVSTPPTEVASLKPRAVVSNSAIACLTAESRVGNSRRYQGLATMRRQSRDNLSASSWA